jgi:hypothetical protein
MELGYFGVENNYLEAILRSLRLSLLKEDNYSQMKNLSTLNDLKQVSNPKLTFSTPVPTHMLIIYSTLKKKQTSAPTSNSKLPILVSTLSRPVLKTNSQKIWSTSRKTQSILLANSFSLSKQAT